MPRNPTRLAVCMHEAGHAIVQLADHPSPWIDWISVEGLSDGNLGRVETESLWQPWYMTVRASPDIQEQWAALAWRDVIFYLAGPVAELRWRRHTRADFLFGADQMAERCLGDDVPDPDSDFGRVRRRLTDAVAGDDRSNFIKAWLETEERVAHWWREIVALGRQLNVQGRIDNEELRRLWKAMKDARYARPRGSNAQVPTGGVHRNRCPQTASS